MSHDMDDLLRAAVGRGDVPAPEEPATERKATYRHKHKPVETVTDEDLEEALRVAAGHGSPQPVPLPKPPERVPRSGSGSVGQTSEEEVPSDLVMDRELRDAFNDKMAGRGRRRW